MADEKKATTTKKATAGKEPTVKNASVSASSDKKTPDAKTSTAGKADTAKPKAATKAKPVSSSASVAKATVAKKADADAKSAGQSKSGSAKKTPAAKTAVAKTAAAKTATSKKTATAKKEPAAKTEPVKKAEAAKKTASAKSAVKAKPVKAAEPVKKTAQVKKGASAKAGEDAKKAEPAKKPTQASKTATSKKAASAKKTPAKGEAAAKEQAAGKTVASKDKAAVEKSSRAKAVEPEKKAGPAQRPEPEKESAAAKSETEKVVEAAREAEPTNSNVAEEPTQPAKTAAEFSDLPGVLIAAAECAPFVKVGGLADVVGALPKYLKKLGVDARIIMPFHRQVKERYGTQTQHMADFQASLGWRSQYVGLEKLELDGVTYYFIDNEFYFGGPIYCGGEFEGEQYSFFTRAVMDSIPLLDFDVKILHCNDWHTAMMPLLAKTQYFGGVQSQLKTLLTIHNLHYQGQFSHEFDRDLLRVDDSLATPEFIEHYGCDNMLKAGIVFADKVNTVSPTYAREICDPYLGESLDGVLRMRGEDLSGILNGIDNDLWNPEADENLPVRFSAKTIERKADVKNALFDELGLWRAPEGEEVPLIGLVSRLVPQKGLDLVRFVLDELMQENVRVIVLGSGFTEFEDFLRDAEGRYKGRLCSYIGYNADLSHRIYAGSDLFLVPSLFEPCGISQMISMRYGTLPIVRETGGLRDTVFPWNEYTGEGNGFSFANYDAGEMLGVIRYALSVWWNRDARAKLIANAMASDFGFERCARSYAELYRTL